jgi:hypothetical protein
MEEPLGRVVKADDVKIQGTFHLDIGRPSAAPAKPASAALPPQVRIVEHHADFAVIEVTCGCGTTSRVRCEYQTVSTNS